MLPICVAELQLHFWADVKDEHLVRLRLSVYKTVDAESSVDGRFRFQV